MPGLRWRWKYNIAHSLCCQQQRSRSEGFALPRPKDTRAEARKLFADAETYQQTGAVIEILNDPKEAVDDAEAAGDAWTSIGHEQEEQGRNRNLTTLR